MEWRNVPDNLDEFPADLYDALFLEEHGKLVKLENYATADYQVATQRTSFRVWERQIPEEEMAENVKLVKLLYRAGAKLLGNVDIPIYK